MKNYHLITSCPFNICAHISWNQIDWQAMYFWQKMRIFLGTCTWNADSYSIIPIFKFISIFYIDMSFSIFNTLLAILARGTLCCLVPGSIIRVETYFCLDEFPCK